MNSAEIKIVKTDAKLQVGGCPMRLSVTWSNYFFNVWHGIICDCQAVTDWFQQSWAHRWHFCWLGYWWGFWSWQIWFTLSGMPSWLRWHSFHLFVHWLRRLQLLSRWILECCYCSTIWQNIHIHGPVNHAPATLQHLHRLSLDIQALDVRLLDYYADLRNSQPDKCRGCGCWLTRDVGIEQ